MGISCSLAHAFPNLQKAGPATGRMIHFRMLTGSRPRERFHHPDACPVLPVQIPWALGGRCSCEPCAAGWAPGACRHISWEYHPWEAAGWSLECECYLCQALGHLQASKSLLGPSGEGCKLFNCSVDPGVSGRVGGAAQEQWAVLVGGKRDESLPTALKNRLPTLYSAPLPQD